MPSFTVKFQHVDFEIDLDIALLYTALYERFGSKTEIIISLMTAHETEQCRNSYSDSAYAAHIESKHLFWIFDENGRRATDLELELINSLLPLSLVETYSSTQ